MKKILIIIPSLGMGGLEKMLINIANFLVKHGNDVSVMNLTWHDDVMRSCLDKKIRYFFNFQPRKFLLNAGWNDLINCKARLLPLTKWMYFHKPGYIHKIYVQEEYDVEIAFYYGQPAQIVAGAGKNTKKIFWVHEIPSKIVEMDQNRRRISSEKKAIDAMDTAICVSKEFVKEVEEKYKCGKVVDIPNLVDVDDILNKGSQTVSDITKNKFTVVFVGRLVIEHKGIDNLLDAVYKLNEEQFDFDVWIIGDGKDMDIINEKIKNEKLKNVAVMGRRDNPYPYIKMADLFILSSRWEAYGLVIAESLILGTPVLATDCDGSRDILENGKYGLLVENSTDGIISGLRKMITEPDIYQHYKEMTKKRLPFFEPEQIIEKICEVI